MQRGMLEQARSLFTDAPENVPPGDDWIEPSRALSHDESASSAGRSASSTKPSVAQSKPGKWPNASDRPYDIIAADYGIGVVQLMQSHLEEAERALDRALRISNQSEARLFRPLVKSALGNVYLQRGWSQRACEILLQARDEADELGHETSKIAASMYLGTAYSQLGQSEHGLSLIRAGQAGAKQKGYGGVEALAAFAEANVLAMQGPLRVEDALGCLQRTAEIAQKLEARPLLGSVKGIRARLLAASGRTSEAQDELIEAIDLFSKSKMTVHLERAKVTLSKFSDT